MLSHKLILPKSPSPLTNSLFSLSLSLSLSPSYFHTYPNPHPHPPLSSPPPLPSPALPCSLTKLAVRPGLKSFGTPVQSCRLQRTRQPSLLSLYLKPHLLRWHTSNASIHPFVYLSILLPWFVLLCSYFALFLFVFSFFWFLSRLALSCLLSSLALISLIIDIPLYLIRH